MVNHHMNIFDFSFAHYGYGTPTSTAPTSPTAQTNSTEPSPRSQVAVERDTNFDEGYGPTKFPYQSAMSSNPDLPVRTDGLPPAYRPRSMRRSPRSHPMLGGIDYWDSNNFRHSSAH